MERSNPTFGQRLRHLVCRLTGQHTPQTPCGEEWAVCDYCGVWYELETGSEKWVSTSTAR